MNPNRQPKEPKSLLARYLRARIAPRRLPRAERRIIFETTREEFLAAARAKAREERQRHGLPLSPEIERRKQ